jgi:hypothetical protein
MSVSSRSVRDVNRTEGERLAALDAFLAEDEAAYGEITAGEMDAAPQRTRVCAGRRAGQAAELTASPPRSSADHGGRS